VKQYSSISLIKLHEKLQDLAQSNAD